MNVTRDGPVRLPGMPLLGKLLRRFRAGEDRSPLSGQGYAAAATIDVTSPAFTDGGAIPQKHAGKGVGDNVSPALQWTGVPTDAKQLVLIMDDLDVPMPKPLMHAIAVIESDVVDSQKVNSSPAPPGYGWSRLSVTPTSARVRSPATDRIIIDSWSSRSTKRSPTRSPATRRFSKRSQATWSHAAA
jgi:hypothetical protein